MCLFSLKGEVLRIRVPFSGEVSPGQAEGGGAHQLLLPDIERQAKEISPRYNGHKVTIQVRYPPHPTLGLWVMFWSMFRIQNQLGQLIRIQIKNLYPDPGPKLFPKK